MSILVDFLMINHISSLDNLCVYAEKIANKLLEKGLITQPIIDRATLEFGNCSLITEISDTVYLIEYVYSAENHNTNWRIMLEFGTFASSSQLQVKAFSGDYALCLEDNYLEQLKFVLKNILKSDWQKIIWLMDKDSEMLSIVLYPCIYRTENFARQIINEIMTKEYGVGWWDIYVPLQIQNKHRARAGGYKSIVPGFADVDERLMSIDISDLISIFTLTEKRWEPVFSAEISGFLNDHLNIKPEKVKEILSAQMVVVKDLWGEQFSKYLSADFINKLKTFELNRNHVVHNKLIDRTAYNSILRSIQVVEDELIKALRRISDVVLSVERHEEIARQMEIEQNEAVIALLGIMESEAGVRIRNADEIIDLFNMHLYEFYSEFQTHFRFRSDIVISNYNDVAIERDRGMLFEITYKINNETININYHINSMNDSQGEESVIEIEAQLNNEGYSKQIRYTNGAVSFNSHQGNYMPETQDDFCTADVGELMDELLEFIKGHFENMREKIDLDMYSIIKDGGSSPVAEGVLCGECGEEYVCVDANYGSYGQCLNCGEMNDICVCSRCGCYFEGVAHLDESNFCDNCLEHFEKL